jgi:hypothetical protein
VVETVEAGDNDDENSSSTNSRLGSFQYIPSKYAPEQRRDDCDYSLHDKRVDHLNSGILNTKINRSEQAMAELMHILRDCPTHIVDDVRSWAFKNSHAISNQKIGLPSRKQLLRKALRRYDLTGLLPLNKLVELVHSGVEAQIAIHTLKEAVYSLLTDLRLQDDECFLFHHDDPSGMVDLLCRSESSCGPIWILTSGGVFGFEPLYCDGPFMASRARTKCVLFQVRMDHWMDLLSHFGSLESYWQGLAENYWQRSRQSDWTEQDGPNKMTRTMTRKMPRTWLQTN